MPRRWSIGACEDVILSCKICTQNHREDNQAKTIVSSILGLADDLNLSVVAEGVETPVQFEVLKTLGCPLIQGYWTGRPMPMVAIKEGMMAATDTEVVRQNSEEM